MNQEQIRQAYEQEPTVIPTGPNTVIIKVTNADRNEILQQPEGVGLVLVSETIEPETDPFEDITWQMAVAKLAQEYPDADFLSIERKTTDPQLKVVGEYELERIDEHNLNDYRSK